MRWPEIDRLSWKLGLSIAALVVGAMVAGFGLVYHQYYRHLLQTVRDAASAEARLVRLALEHQMLDKDRRLLNRMVKSFASKDWVQRVMVLDRKGRVKISSVPGEPQRLGDRSATCRGCHQHPPARRPLSAMIEVDGGTVLRCVEPLRNQKACQGCHDARHRINGLIIVDLPLSPTVQGLRRAVGGMALGTGAVGLVLLAGIGLVFRRLVMRRLLRFESTARAIADGDLARRMPVQGDDALTRVESQFNRMADAVTALLASLRQERANLEKVMNSVDDGVVVLDRTRRVTAANQAFLRRFVGEPIAVGRICCELRERGGLGCGGQGECPSVACFESGAVQTVIRSRVTPKGEVRVEEVRASPVHGEGGEIVQVVEVWRDITDRRSAEARLADYQRLVSLGMLASGFSHEINTPLGSIRTCLDALQGGVAASDAEELLRIATTQVERCGTLTRQFLQLARGQQLSRGIVDLRQTAQVIAGLTRHTAETSGVSIVVEEADLPGVLANEAAVQQVLLNLVLNAVEASSHGGRVAIELVAGDPIQVTVADQGCGIAAADLPSIFEPFFTRRAAGTGLGLFVSLNLARGWGGDIRVDSQPGAGSRFTVTFPKEESDGSDADPGGG